jgi:hypothetical protein
MWARLSTHWVSGESATIAIYAQPRGARGRFAPRTNVGHRVRVPPRRGTASRPWQINSTCQCGRDVRRIGFASSPATVSIYVPTRVSPRPRHSLLLLATDFAPAPTWARCQTCGARHIEFSTLSFVEQIKSAAFFSVPCALVPALIRRQNQFIQLRTSLFYLFQRQFC